MNDDLKFMLLNADFFKVVIWFAVGAFAYCYFVLSFDPNTCTEAVEMCSISNGFVCKNINELCAVKP